MMPEHEKIDETLREMAGIRDSLRSAKAGEVSRLVDRFRTAQQELEGALEPTQSLLTVDLPETWDQLDSFIEDISQWI